MVRLLFICIAILLCTTCSCDRTVTLILGEEHTWERVSGRPLWHTLTLTKGDSLTSIPLSVGERELTLLLPPRATVVFTAYPLGKLAPLGGALQGDERGGEILLRPQEGELCRYLQKINRDWSLVVSNLLYRNIVRDTAAVKNIHYPSLIQSLVTDTYSPDSFHSCKLYRHTLEFIPSGRYHLDGYEGISFFKGNYQEALLPPLPSGVHTFLNHEKLLSLKVIISDSEESAPAFMINTPDIIFTISQSDYHAMY